jgi:hypothetical protein
LLNEIMICNHDDESSSESEDDGHGHILGQENNNAGSSNQYHDAYTKSKKLFRKMQKKTEELRLE